MSMSLNRRVLSGMRPTGSLHLEHYHGVLKNWINLQHEYECFFFIADWHALTTNYEDTLHNVFSSDDVKSWAIKGCKSASLGCVDCKGPLIDSVLKEQQLARERALEYLNNPESVQAIIDEWSERSREVARDTLEEVKDAMGLNYR